MQQIMQVISQAPQSVQQELQEAIFQFILNIIQWGIQNLQQLGSNGLTALQSIEQGPNQQNVWWNSQTNGNQNGIGYRHKRNTNKKGKKHVRV
uniref:Uncharacterized protein n=1 Tax=Acrobeloides nanus TaxID=290746 RepID=A0A914EP38_9BILA